jgi:hypothetical protein
MPIPKLMLAAFAAALAVTPVRAGEADVVDVAVRASGGAYNFDVTVRHADTGWEHYADKWDVVAMDGTVLATRTLLHPHVGEQPFTRSLGNVRVPAGATEVRIRAHDKVHGYGGVELIVDLATGATRPAPGGAS